MYENRWTITRHIVSWLKKKCVEVKSKTSGKNITQVLQEIQRNTSKIRLQHRLPFTEVNGKKVPSKVPRGALRRETENTLNIISKYCNDDVIHTGYSDGKSLWDQIFPYLGAKAIALCHGYI